MAGIMQAESSGVHAPSQQPGGHPLPGPRISHGDHRLVAAARDGDVKKLRKLLQKHGVNVNARDSQTGNTALMVASLVQDPDAIAALLEAGADPTLHNYTGQNCLDSLTPSLVQYVLRSPDIVDCAGVKSDEKRLLLAAWSGNKEQVLRLLTTTSVDVNCTNAEGSTPLTLLCRDLGTFTELYANQVIDSYDPLSVIQILLEHGVLIHRDVNHQDRQGRSCLHYAAHTRCEHTAPVIAMLLHHGAKVEDMKDKHGFCPVHFASQSGSVEALRLLLDAGADPSAPGLGGITPLHLAASAGNTEAVILLLDRGADSLTFASDGKSPLCCAANQEVYNVLRRAVEARLASPNNSSLRSEKKKLAELILQQSGPSVLQQSEEEDDSSETESPPNLSEAEGAARNQRYDGHEVAPDDLRRRLVEDDIQLMNQVQKILDESEWEEKSSVATLDPSAAYHHQTTMPSNSVLDPSPEVARLTVHDNPLLDPDDCADGPCYSVASKKSNGADIQPELPPRFSSVSRPRAKKPSPHLSRMKLDRETAESLTHARHSHIDTNSHYYYKFPATSMGTAESDNDSLYTKPEERAAIVRPSRPSVQQPMKLSILKPTAAASAAKGALLSKFLPPWANRASHLSSASWVYLPQISPGESGDVAYSDDDDGASPSPQPPMAMNSATIGSNGSGDNIVVPQLPARSSLSLTRRDARKPPKNPVCPAVPGLQKDSTYCAGQVYANPTRDSTSNLASQIPPNVKVIDAPQTMSNARRAKGSTALNSRPLGGSLRPASKPQGGGIHSDPKMVPPTPKSFPEIPAFSSDPPFPWVKGKLIGKGAFGLVWCGMNSTGQLVAVKQFQIQEQQHTDDVLSAVQLEVDILQSLKHMNIVGFLGVQQDGANINLFLEFVSGGTLASNLAQFGAFPESVVQRYARQLFQAVAYLHSRSVIHRDIKGNNVMVCPGTGTIKIIDFGCATFDPSGTDHERLAASARGTPYWMAPEVICQQECSHKSDMWSIGCTLIEMFQTKPPWYELSPLAAAFAIGQGTSDPKLPDHLSQHARDITMKCLNRTPAERPTAEEILGHPFLQTGDIESNAS